MVFRSWLQSHLTVKQPKSLTDEVHVTFSSFCKDNTFLPISLRFFPNFLEKLLSYDRPIISVN